MVPLIVFLPIGYISDFSAVGAGSCKGTVGASRLLERKSCIELEYLVRLLRL